MIYTCYGCKNSKIREMSNPGKNPDPGQKSGSRIPEKFFFDFLYFSIVNNFCKISFFLKRLFTQKKYVFCIFHVLQLPPANRETDVVLFYNIKIKMALSFTSSKSPQFFFPGIFVCRDLQTVQLFANFLTTFAT